MEHSEGNIDQQLLLRFLLQSIQRQRQAQQPVDLSGNKLVSIRSPDLNRPDAYSERRRKNNEAAKRSRDARRAKEDEIAMRATWLEQENVKLRRENAQLKQENVQLRCHALTTNTSGNSSAL